jgi:hypothetical protein
MKRGVSNAVEGVEETAIEPLLNNVTEIVAMEIQKTFDFYRATLKTIGQSSRRYLSPAAVPNSPAWPRIFQHASSCPSRSSIRSAT